MTPAPLPEWLEEVLAAVRGRRAPAAVATKIVAVDGLGGAGKSSFAALLARELGGAPALQTDDFASWEQPLEWWPRLIEEALEPLAAGRPARFPATDWAGTGEERWVEVAAGGVVVLEGVSASRQAFRPFLTYALWVETPRELRLRRGLDRDGEDARAQWEAWMAEEDAYVERERPAECADLVLRGDRDLWR